MVASGDYFFINSLELYKVTNEYQYAIADHQGNTRVLFSSATPAAIPLTATFEGDANDNSSQFTNVNAGNVVSFTAANHTTRCIKVVRLNQAYSVGPAKSRSR